MLSIMREEQNQAAAQGREPQPVDMRFSTDAARDARRYNMPSVEAVAVIFVGVDGAPPSNRDIVVYALVLNDIQ